VDAAERASIVWRRHHHSTVGEQHSAGSSWENELAQRQHDMSPSTTKQNLLRDRQAASLPYRKLIAAEFGVELCAYAKLEDLSSAALDLFNHTGIRIAVAIHHDF